MSVLLTTGHRGTNKTRRLHTPPLPPLSAHHQTTTTTDPFAAELQELLDHQQTISQQLHHDAKPLDDVHTGCLQITIVPEKPITRLENLILEAITTLKEPKGSNHTNISRYIEGQYDAPPNFRMVFSEALKGLISSGKLMKVNRKYRIPPSAALSEIRRNSEVPQEKMQKDPSRGEKVGLRILTKAQVDAELANMRTMTPQEAAAAAARTVSVLEVALEAAEKAANEADVAEVDAEEAEDAAEKVKKKMRKYLYI